MDEINQQAHSDLISALLENKRTTPDFSIDPISNSLIISFSDPESEILEKAINKNITLMFFQPNKGKAKVTGIKIAKFNEVFGEKISKSLQEQDHQLLANQMANSLILASKQKENESSSDYLSRLEQLSNYSSNIVINDNFNNDIFLNAYANRFSSSVDYIHESLLYKIIESLSPYRHKIPSYHTLFYNAYDKIIKSKHITPEKISELDPGPYVRSEFNAESESSFIDNHLDILILKKHYQAIDDILNELWINSLPSSSIIAYVKSTYGIKRFLNKRTAFYNKIMEIFKSRGDKKSIKEIKQYE